jgi:hypothetical protein
MRSFDSGVASCAVSYRLKAFVYKGLIIELRLFGFFLKRLNQTTPVWLEWQIKHLHKTLLREWRNEVIFAAPFVF